MLIVISGQYNLLALLAVAYCANVTKFVKNGKERTKVSRAFVSKSFLLHVVVSFNFYNYKSTFSSINSFKFF